FLQGRVACCRGGDACSGQGRHVQAGAAQPARYGYYGCNGRRQLGEDGAQVCRTRSVRAQELEAAVWDDVCALLADPTRVEQEYQRRQQGQAGEGAGAEAAALAKRVAAVLRGISRLIDGYS